MKTLIEITKRQEANFFVPQPHLTRQAVEALIEKLGVAKAAEFWASMDYGYGDYTKLKKQLFRGETVETLYKKILKYQKNKKIIFNFKRFNPPAGGSE